jgi:hypothetical protein
MYRTVTDSEGNKYRLTFSVDAENNELINLDYKGVNDADYRLVFEAQKDNVFDIFGEVTTEEG